MRIADRCLGNPIVTALGRAPSIRRRDVHRLIDQVTHLMVARPGLGIPPSRRGRRPWLACWPASLPSQRRIDGKFRARILVPPDIDADDLRALALSSPAVVDALGGTNVSRVIVRPPGLVNIVLAS